MGKIYVDSTGRKIEVRTYEQQELHCDISPSIWFRDQQDMCGLAKKQNLNGITFPWGSLALFKMEKDKLKLTNVAVQSFFMTGGEIKWGQIVMRGVTYVYFGDNGRVRQIDTSGGQALSEGWDICCSLKCIEGCKMLFNEDAEFERCETYDYPGSD